MYVAIIHEIEVNTHMDEIVLLSNSKTLYGQIKRYCRCAHTESILETTAAAGRDEVHFIICDVDSYDFDMGTYLKHLQEVTHVIVIIYTESSENDHHYHKNHGFKFFLNSEGLPYQLNQFEESHEYQIFNA